MEIPIVVVSIVGMIGGLLIVVFGLRDKADNAASFDKIDGDVKEDWTPTGKIDFQIFNPSGASYQALILRVEERKIISTALGQEVAQLRWRLAALEEAKELVVCWNRWRSAESDEHGMPGLTGLRVAGGASR